MSNLNMTNNNENDGNGGNDNSNRGNSETNESQTGEPQNPVTSSTVANNGRDLFKGLSLKKMVLIGVVVVVIIYLVLNIPSKTGNTNTAVKDTDHLNTSSASTDPKELGVDLAPEPPTAEELELERKLNNHLNQIVSLKEEHAVLTVRHRESSLKVKYWINGVRKSKDLIPQVKESGILNRDPNKKVFLNAEGERFSLAEWETLIFLDEDLISATLIRVKGYEKRMFEIDEEILDIQNQIEEISKSLKSVREQS